MEEQYFREREEVVACELADQRQGELRLHDSKQRGPKIVQLREQ